MKIISQRIHSNSRWLNVSIEVFRTKTFYFLFSRDQMKKYDDAMIRIVWN